MDLKVLLSVTLILAVSVLVNSQEEGVYGEDATFILNQPVALNAKKFSKALQNQDVVATCRYILYKTWKDWYDAKDSCQNITLPMTLRVKGSMATVKTEEENKDLVTLMKLGFGVKRVGKKYNRNNWVWLGLEKTINNDIKQDKKKVGEEYFVPSEWKWIDSSEPVWWNWQKKMPDGAKDKKSPIFQDKVSLSKSGQWDDSLQYKTMPYACNYCGKYIVIKKHVKWEQARSMCESFGLSMAVVNSKEENEDLDKAAKLMMGEEVDVKRWNDTNWIWIGTHEVMDVNGVGTGEWQHHDGSALLWSPPWDYKRQPDNWVRRSGEQQAVAFSRINGRWDDSFLSRERPFACMCPDAACSTSLY